MNKLGLDYRLINATLSHVKRGFVPSDAASAGGAPPGDPSGGGMPPDPSGGAGMPPPPDAGAMPPGPPPPGDGGGLPPASPDIASTVTNAVTQAIQSSGMSGNKGPTAPKPDINTVATDIFQLKKMFLHFLRIQGIELPPDILDGPNRDPQTGAPAFGQAGGSDAQPGSSAVQAGGQSAIKPISPMQGAFPSAPGAGGGSSGGGGLGKTGSDRLGRAVTSDRVMSKAAAVAIMLRKQRTIAA